jgi:Tol biopolymer transport system component
MYTMSSEGGTPHRLLPDEKNWDSLPDWSPDGKKIVFDQSPAGAPGFGWLEGEKTRILELDTGNVTDLPPCPRSCYFPRWSPGGRYILEITTDHDDVMLLDLQTSRWSQFNLHRGSIGVSSQGHINQSVRVRPRLTDSSLVAWEASWSESEMMEPSDNMLRKEYAQLTRL